MYGDFHYKDKTDVRQSYLYNGNPYTGKTTSLYWDGILVEVFGHHAHLQYVAEVVLSDLRQSFHCFRASDLILKALGKAV